MKDFKHDYRHDDPNDSPCRGVWLGLLVSAPAWLVLALMVTR
jgi:hypothetical protein